MTTELPDDGAATPREVTSASSSPALRSAPIVVGVGIGVGVDSGEASRWALAAGGQLAELSDAPLVVVHVVRRPIISPAVIGMADMTSSEDCASTVFPEVVEALAPYDVRWSIVARVGNPAVLLDRVARDLAARVVLVGSRRPGLAGRVRALVGLSVPDWLLRHCDIPVQIVARLPSTAG